MFRCRGLPFLPEEVSLEPSAAQSAGHPPGAGTASAPGLPPFSLGSFTLLLPQAVTPACFPGLGELDGAWPYVLSREGQGRARFLSGSVFCAAWGHRGFGFCPRGPCAPEGRPRLAALHGVPLGGLQFWVAHPLLWVSSVPTIAVPRMWVGPGLCSCSSFLLLARWEHPSLPPSSVLPRLPCPLSAAWCSLGTYSSLWGVGTAPPVSGVGSEGPGDLDSPSERPCSEIIGTGVDLLDPKPFSAGGQPRGLGCLTPRLRLSVLICHVRR